MQNHKRTETAARLKKIYSSLSQAIKLAETEQGAPISEWGNIVDSRYSGSTETMYADGLIFWNKYLAKYFPINDQTQCSDWSSCSFLAQFNDGSQIVSTSGWINGYSYINFTIDVNGPKGPNKSGRDRFSFYLNLKENPKQLLGGYLVYKEAINNNKTTNYTREELLKECKSNTGYCLDLIMNDGWEIKDDYPIRL